MPSVGKTRETKVYVTPESVQSQVDQLIIRRDELRREVRDLDHLETLQTQIERKERYLEQLVRRVDQEAMVAEGIVSEAENQMAQEKVAFDKYKKAERESIAEEARRVEAHLRRQREEIEKSRKDLEIEQAEAQAEARENQEVSLRLSQEQDRLQKQKQEFEDHRQKVIEAHDSAMRMMDQAQAIRKSSDENIKKAAEKENLLRQVEAHLGQTQEELHKLHEQAREKLRQQEAQLKKLREKEQALDREHQENVQQQEQILKLRQTLTEKEAGLAKREREIQRIHQDQTGRETRILELESRVQSDLEKLEAARAEVRGRFADLRKAEEDLRAGRRQ